jgi:hypothetical protein
MAFAPQRRLDHEPEKRDQLGRTPQRFASDHSVKRCADLIICRAHSTPFVVRTWRTCPDGAIQEKQPRAGVRLSPSRLEDGESGSRLSRPETGRAPGR